MKNNIFDGIEIYAFSGKLGSGKNFISEKVFIPMLEPKPTLVVSLADHFKIDAIVKDKMSYESVFVKKTNESRKALQYRGTEDGRDKYGEDIWFNTLTTWMQVHIERGIKRFILTDLRFISEFNSLKNIGAVTLRIIAPERNKDTLLRESNNNEVVYQQIANHSSEVNLDSQTEMFDYVIKNDYNDIDVFNQIENIINDIQIKLKHKYTIFIDLDDTIIHTSCYYDKAIHEAGNWLYYNYYIFNSISNDSEIDFIKSFRALFFTIGGKHEKKHTYPERFAEELVKTTFEILDFYHIVFDKENISDKVFKIGMRVWEHNYEPIENAVDVVKELNEKYKVVIVTAGERKKQYKKLCQIGLFNIDFEVFDHKTTDILRHLKSKYKAHEYVFIGDSLERDIKPSLKVGINHVFFLNYKNVKIKKKLREKSNFKNIKHITEVLENL